MAARFATLAVVLEAALGLRIAAADAVEWLARRREALCVFPDTNIYWALARAIRIGAPFEVMMWGDLPHFALRTPGYPLFLALCQAAFGERTLPVRLVQAVLGALSVWLVYRLTERTIRAPAENDARGWTVPLLAAALAAVDPYLVVTAVLLLSEAVFLPLMTAAQWGFAVLWSRPGDLPPRHSRWLAFGVGLASGVAIHVRPSWALFVPGMLATWVAASGRDRRRSALVGATLVALGVVAVMAPWWIRNARIYGRFVPTALWMGASLYDGLNPRATGASDMEFLNEPPFRDLGEEEQDAVLRTRAWEFARANPGRAARLALIKLARYWSPWPNAEGFTSIGIALASALWSVPLLLAIALGAWDLRRDLRSLVLFAGPLLYFCALHMVFAGSMRYRIPGMMPAMGLAALGVRRLVRGRGMANDE